MIPDEFAHIRLYYFDIIATWFPVKFWHKSCYRVIATEALSLLLSYLEERVASWIPTKLEIVVLLLRQYL